MGCNASRDCAPTAVNDAQAGAEAAAFDTSIASASSAATAPAAAPAAISRDAAAKAARADARRNACATARAKLCRPLVPEAVREQLGAYDPASSSFALAPPDAPGALVHGAARPAGALRDVLLGLTPAGDVDPSLTKSVLLLQGPARTALPTRRAMRRSELTRRRGPVPQGGAGAGMRQDAVRVAPASGLRGQPARQWTDPARRASGLAGAACRRAARARAADRRLPRLAAAHPRGAWALSGRRPREGPTRRRARAHAGGRCPERPTDSVRLGRPR
jgi:hypothetical protein